MTSDLLDALDWRRQNPTSSTCEGAARLKPESADRLLRWFRGHPYIRDPDKIQRALDVLLWCQEQQHAARLEDVAARFSLPATALAELATRASNALSSASSSPRFIAIEGIDGAGKQTQTQLLEEALRARGATVQTFSFPEYGRFFGREIGRLLSGRDPSASAASLDSRSMALWYAMDRWETLSAAGLVAPAARLSVDYVLFNRYTLSSAAYQGARTRAEERATLMAWIFDLEHGQLRLPAPDLYIILDVPTPTSQENVSKKGHRDYAGTQPDVYEKSSSLLNDARGIYTSFAAQNSSAVIVNCMTQSGTLASANLIHSRVLQEVDHAKSSV